MNFVEVELSWRQSPLEPSVTCRSKCSRFFSFVSTHKFDQRRLRVSDVKSPEALLLDTVILNLKLQAFLKKQASPILRCSKRPSKDLVPCPSDLSEVSEIVRRLIAILKSDTKWI